MTNRRAFLAGAAAMIAAPRVARAQSAGKVYRIGYLGSGPEAAARRDPLFPVFFLGRLRELGWAEGQNLTIEYRSSDGQDDRYRLLAEDLVRLKVDLIVAPGTSAALGARDATKTIPIVTVLVADPVSSGLVASLARPGGNVTGMSSAAADVAPKQLELLKELAPRLSRVAVLWNPTALVGPLRAIEEAARTLNVRLQRRDVRTAQAIEAAFSGMTKDRVEAAIVMDSAFVHGQRQRIAELALQQRLPTVSTQRTFSEAGMLMSYGAGFADLFRRAAVYVVKIIRGARPAELPIEQPTIFELVINAKTAKALGVTIPASLLKRADQVIA